MARPIKDTPILSGKDAKNFLEEMKKSDLKKMDSQKRAKIKADFDLLNSISKF